VPSSGAGSRLGFLWCRAASNDDAERRVRRGLSWGAALPRYWFIAAQPAGTGLTASRALVPELPHEHPGPVSAFPSGAELPRSALVRFLTSTERPVRLGFGRCRATFVAMLLRSIAKRWTGLGFERVPSYLVAALDAAQRSWCTFVSASFGAELPRLCRSNDVETT